MKIADPLFFYIRTNVGRFALCIRANNFYI
jgi:hypothetical protein